MKKKDLQQLKKKEKEELVKKASDLRQEVISAKVDLSAGKKTSSKKPKALRRDLAQVLTILREMEIVQKEKKT